MYSLVHHRIEFGKKLKHLDIEHYGIGPLAKLEIAIGDVLQQTSLEVFLFEVTELGPVLRVKSLSDLKMLLHSQKSCYYFLILWLIEGRELIDFLLVHELVNDMELLVVGNFL